MVDRISTFDIGYLTGDLSVYPTAIDNSSILYEARNNAVTKLKQTLSFNAKNIIVEDASRFPLQGLLRIGPPPGVAGLAELAYYGSRSDTVFSSLKRGFAGSRQTKWDIGASVANSVMAEHHNAIKDALINIENNLGVKKLPESESLNGILKELEGRFLAPKALFRAFPLKGPPPFSVRFQNFSGGQPIRFLWDFGDGSTSLEQSPIHTYQREGSYSVKLNMITSTGGQGIVKKLNYITVSEDATLPFFYTVPMNGISRQTAINRTNNGNPTNPTEFDFVDQTDGSIISRFWIFDDGTNLQENDPDIHTVKHIYNSAGIYTPTLLVIFSDQRFKRVVLEDPIIAI